MNIVITIELYLCVSELFLVVIICGLFVTLNFIICATSKHTVKMNMLYLINNQLWQQITNNIINEIEQI